MSVLWPQQIREDLSETTSVKLILIQSDLPQQHPSRQGNFLYFDRKFNDFSHFILTGSTGLFEMFLFQVTLLPDLKARMFLNSKFKFSQLSRFLIHLHWTCFAHACSQQWNCLKSWFIFPRGYRLIICTLQSLFPLACCPWDEGKSSVTSAENPTCLIWPWTDGYISLTPLEFPMLTFNNWQQQETRAEKPLLKHFFESQCCLCAGNSIFIWSSGRMQSDCFGWSDPVLSCSDMCVAGVLRSQLILLATTFCSTEPGKMPRQIRPSFRVSPAS